MKSRPPIKRAKHPATLCPAGRSTRRIDTGGACRRCSAKVSGMTATYAPVLAFSPRFAGMLLLPWQQAGLPPFC
jgi:hypothetical protein